MSIHRLCRGFGKRHTRLPTVKSVLTFSFEQKKLVGGIVNLIGTLQPVRSVQRASDLL